MAMHTYLYKIKLCVYIYFCLCGSVANGEEIIENFTGVDNISQWIEHSDTIQNLGKSKGTLVLLQTATYKHAVLFTLLNPQPCGAAFAGIKKSVSLNLSRYTNITLKVRGHGSYTGYKLILKEKSYKYSFCTLFEVSEHFSEIVLPFQEFKPYYEGKLVNDSNVQLNLASIISIGIQAYGGVYLPRKQSGVATLEIEWIKVN